MAAGTVAIITVLIYNPGAVPEKTLARAQNVASAIFAKSGISLRWRNARREDALPGPAQIPLHLLPTRPPRLHPDAAGFAVIHPGDGNQSYAGISYPAIADTAAQFDAELHVVLGVAFAHEIGHVLLGSPAHSPTGVMSARLRPEDIAAAARGTLHFPRAPASPAASPHCN